MRNLKFIPLSLLLIFAFTQLKSQEVSSFKDFVHQDHASTEYIFSKGIYYSYTFEGEGPFYEFDEKAVIQKLKDAKIDIQEVWYRPASSNCRPPGSDLAMTVIVDPAFVVRLDKANKDMQKFGFNQTDEPSLGDCAYYVRHYTAVVDAPKTEVVDKALLKEQQREEKALKKSIKLNKQILKLNKKSDKLTKKRAKLISKSDKLINKSEKLHKDNEKIQLRSKKLQEQSDELQKKSDK